jgi:hypothetical protein
MRNFPLTMEEPCPNCGTPGREAHCSCCGYDQLAPPAPPDQGRAPSLDEIVRGHVQRVLEKLGLGTGSDTEKAQEGSASRAPGAKEA